MMEMPPKSLLTEMCTQVSEEECAELAIPSYLHWNPLMRWMAEWRIRILAAWLTDYADSSSEILDFGCGCGVLFQHASRRAQVVYGVDPVLKPAQLLVDYYGLQNVQLMTPCSVEDYVVQGSIDVIVCGEVLEHIGDLESVLEQLRQKMKPRGHLLVTLPTENTLYRFGRRLAGFRGDYHFHAARIIHRKVQRFGFQEVRRREIPLPGPLSVYWAIDYIRIS